MPVQELGILAHSMGGLVARSAVWHATQTGQRWLAQLRHLIFLGAPHHGAPLARAGPWVDLLLASTPYSRPFTRLGHLRSAGISDLRYGHVLDADWQGRDRLARSPDTRTPVPLPDGVACHAVAATLAAQHSPLGVAGRRRAGALRARWAHDNPARCLAFAPADQYVVAQRGHLTCSATRQRRCALADAAGRRDLPRPPPSAEASPTSPLPRGALMNAMQGGVAGTGTSARSEDKIAFGALQSSASSYFFNSDSAPVAHHRLENPPRNPSCGTARRIDRRERSALHLPLFHP